MSHPRESQLIDNLIMPSYMTPLSNPKRPSIRINNIQLQLNRRLYSSTTKHTNDDTTPMPFLKANYLISRKIA